MAEEFLILVQNIPESTSAQQLIEKFSEFGPVFGTTQLSAEAALVRFTQEDSVSRAVSAVNGTTWQGRVLRVDSCDQTAGSVEAASVPALQTTESASSQEPAITSVQRAASSFMEHTGEGFFNSAVEDGLCQPLEDSTAGDAKNLSEGGSSDAGASSAHSSFAAPLSARSSTNHMDDVWSDMGRPTSNSGLPPGLSGMQQQQQFSQNQKSIANTARQDLARMAAIANMAQTNPNTPSPWTNQGMGAPGMYGYEGGSNEAAMLTSQGSGQLGMKQSLPAMARPSPDLAGLEQMLELQGVNLANMGEEQRMMMIGRFVVQQQAMQQQAMQQGLQAPSRQQMAPSTPPHGATGGMSMGPGGPQAGVGNFRQTSVSLPHTPIKYNESLVPAANNASALSSPTVSTGSAPPTTSPPADEASMMSNLLGGAGGGAGGQINPGFAAALAQLAQDNNLDQGALLSILQNPKALDLLIKQAQPPPPQGGSSRVSLDRKNSMGSSGLGGNPNLGPGGNMGGNPTLGTRTSGLPSVASGVSNVPEWAQQAAANAAANQSGGMGGAAGNRANLDTVPNMQSMLSSHLLQEFTSSRNVLVQLMLSAYAFLNSDSMRDFYDKLSPIAHLYDEMHDLPVVQKRRKCQEMGQMRQHLMKDQNFVQILQAVCALRHHLHSLSRKVLVMNQGPDGIPIDLLLGSMSSELYHLMKNMLPQEVSDFFGNNLPHPKLATLVFSEFTSVDPMPTMG